MNTYYENDGTKIELHTGFRGLITYEFKRDATSGAFYTVVRVPQTDEYGNKQYPFVIRPNYPDGGVESTLEMCSRLNFLVAINAGGFYTPYTYPETGGPQGMTIQNGVIVGPAITWDNPDDHRRILTIDSNGNLGYAPRKSTGEELIANGVVSSCYGAYPLIHNYENIDEYEEDLTDAITTDGSTDTQRQVICQYENGDYLIITSEGRNNRGEGYFSVRRLQALCKEYGVKFSFMLDGGSSTETVVGKKQLNNIYEYSYGRPMPVYIVFNGTTQFKASNT